MRAATATRRGIERRLRDIGVSQLPLPLCQHGSDIRSLPTAFLTVPMFSLFLSLRNQAPWYRKELVSCSCPDVREYTKVRNPKIGRPRVNFLCWLGHEPLCGLKVPKSERDQCRGWVCAPHLSPSSSMFDYPAGVQRIRRRRHREHIRSFLPRECFCRHGGESIYLCFDLK